MENYRNGPNKKVHQKTEIDFNFIKVIPVKKHTIFMNEISYKFKIEMVFKFVKEMSLKMNRYIKIKNCDLAY